MVSSSTETARRTERDKAIEANPLRGMSFA
jgi:hypothetical protein